MENNASNIPQIIGLLFVISSIVLFVLFKFYIVNPTLTPLQQGMYGEMYGPISIFKIFVYAGCVFHFVIGWVIMLMYGVLS